MTRSNQSPDTIDGKVCCLAVPSANNLIEKRDVLESIIDDDDDIEWPENPFGYCDDQITETPEELLAMIRFEGSVGSSVRSCMHVQLYSDHYNYRSAM